MHRPRSWRPHRTVTSDTSGIYRRSGHPNVTPAIARCFRFCDRTQFKCSVFHFRGVGAISYQLLRSLDNRITRLANLTSDTAALKFIHQELVPKWSATREQLCTADTENADFDFLNSERVVSPSDFGFHNCIRQHDGSLIFYDFEYAGLDDPAKLICDFFCQVDVPVPATFLDEALDEFGRHLDRREALKIRVRMLMPIIQLKWCCILLNEFLDIRTRRGEPLQAHLRMPPLGNINSQKLETLCALTR